ncbi:uncharacterized protein METZ01_LOCUS305873 [marine metagenome]|jgi:hypothetical protein|uniref:Uncharacterized protein n=1 Tax=marine metagenome TaxID=408172 RepID=A0A382MVV0_9ZZZZ
MLAMSDGSLIKHERTDIYFDTLQECKIYAESPKNLDYMTKEFVKIEDKQGSGINSVFPSCDQATEL